MGKKDKVKSKKKIQRGQKKNNEKKGRNMREGKKEKIREIIESRKNGKERKAIRKRLECERKRQT